MDNQRRAIVVQQRQLGERTAHRGRVTWRFDVSMRQ